MIESPILREFVDECVTEAVEKAVGEANEKAADAARQQVVESKRHDILCVLTSRLGDVPATTTTLLERVQSLGTFDDLIVVAATCSTLESFEERLQQAMTG